MYKIKSKKKKGGYYPPIGNLIRVENPKKVVYKQPTEKYYSDLKKAWLNEGKPFTPPHVNCEKRLDLFQWNSKEGQIYPDESYCIQDGFCRIENGKCKRHPPIMCRNRYGTSWDKDNNECTLDNICGKCGPTREFCCEKDNGWHEKIIDKIQRCGKKGIGTGRGTECGENLRLLISYPIDISLFNDKDLKQIMSRTKTQIIRRFKIGHQEILKIDVYSGSTIVRIEFSSNIEKHILKFMTEIIKAKPIKILAKNFIVESNCASLVSSGDNFSCIQSLVLIIPIHYEKLTDEYKKEIKKIISDSIKEVTPLRKKDIPEIIIENYKEQVGGGDKKEIIKITIKFNSESDEERNQEILYFLKSDEFFNKLNINAIITGDTSAYHPGFMMFANSDPIIEDLKNNKDDESSCEKLKKISEEKDLINNNRDRIAKRQKAIKAVCDYENLSDEEREKLLKKEREEKTRSKEEREKRIKEEEEKRKKKEKEKIHTKVKGKMEDLQKNLEQLKTILNSDNISIDNKKKLSSLLKGGKKTRKIRIKKRTKKIGGNKGSGSGSGSGPGSGPGSGSGLGSGSSGFGSNSAKYGSGSNPFGLSYDYRRVKGLGPGKCRVFRDVILPECMKYFNHLDDPGPKAPLYEGCVGEVYQNKKRDSHPYQVIGCGTGSWHMYSEDEIEHMDPLKNSNTRRPYKGDKVKIISGDKRYIGKVGKIIDDLGDQVPYLIENAGSKRHSVSNVKLISRRPTIKNNVMVKNLDKRDGTGILLHPIKP